MQNARIATRRSTTTIIPEAAIEKKVGRFWACLAENSGCREKTTWRSAYEPAEQMDRRRRPHPKGPNDERRCGATHARTARWPVGRKRRRWLSQGQSFVGLSSRRGRAAAAPPHRWVAEVRSRCCLGFREEEVTPIARRFSSERVL